jgi:NitT/TauT family transport system permease protein
MKKGEKAMKGRFLRKTLFTLGAFGVLFLAWWIAFFCVGNPLLLPSPWKCFEKFGELLSSSRFWSGFFATCIRALSAFLISAVVALVLAVIAYLLPSFRAFLTPIVAFMRALPTVAVVLIILVFLTPDGAPVAVSCLVLLPMLYSSALAAFSGVDGKLVEMCEVYRVPMKKRIFSLYIPCVSPYLIREGTAGLSFSLKLTVSAEVLANTFQSVGGMMQESKIYLEIPTLFALTLFVVLVGLIVELLGGGLAALVERRVK